ncbi:MAG TPA: hypothetical protein VG756_30900 [Pseudonocardiaceae bacterium]|jgi:predicted GNAT superfamily acetyltransferase|nr:hypothetical protein [Pseudonocardiaceae bacterium]
MERQVLGLGAVLADAQRHAAAALDAAGVRVEVVTGARELAEVAELFVRIWGSGAGQPPLAADVMCAVAHAGGAVHAAYAGDRLAGAATAFFGPPESASVYSYIAGAHASDRGVGYGLKLAQRAWALDHGARTMRWTFDPLVSRNGRFNLVKLGAVANEYTVDFYGPLPDGTNTGDETDRLTACWLLDGNRASTAAEDALPVPGGPPAAIERGAPDGGPLTARDERGRWCRVPTDILTVRRASPDLAARWRFAVREVMTEALADGLTATGVTRDGWYLFTEEAR